MSNRVTNTIGVVVLLAGIILSMLFFFGVFSEGFQISKEELEKDKAKANAVMTPKQVADAAAKAIQDQVQAMKKLVEDDKERQKKLAAEKEKEKENAKKGKEVPLTPKQIADNLVRDAKVIEDQVKAMKKAVEDAQKKKIEQQKIGKK